MSNAPLLRSRWSLLAGIILPWYRASETSALSGASCSDRYKRIKYVHRRLFQVLEASMRREELTLAQATSIVKSAFFDTANKVYNLGLLPQTE